MHEQSLVVPNATKVIIIPNALRYYSCLYKQDASIYAKILLSIDNRRRRREPEPHERRHIIYIYIIFRPFRGTMNRNITLIMGIFYGTEEREEGHLIKKGKAHANHLPELN